MKFLTSETYPNKGLSIVSIEHKGKNYRGEAKLHPEDTWSEFTGCRFAEERAEIKALKDEYKQKRHDCDECRKFVTAVQQYAKFDPKSPSAKVMFRQLKCRIKEVNRLADEINKKEFNLRVAIRQQDRFNQKVTKVN